MDRGRRPSRVLVLNAGSSSLKGALVDAPGGVMARAELAWGPDSTRVADRVARVAAMIADLCDDTPGVGPDAVGHRVVHGGSGFRGPVAIDAAVLEEIRALRALAPLHNDVALDVIEAARAALPDVPHAACFDTAFHATLPEEAWRYPLPRAWHERWGVRRHGFHGLSVDWAVGRTAELLGRPAGALGIVVAHLGSGCSVTAVQDGRSVDTSMGWTPLEGLMMGTRAGSIDPGIAVRLLADGRLTAAELEQALDHDSGLIAIAGTADMRAIAGAADRGEADASLALAMFARRAAAGIAGAATALRRLDAIAFTGGIGERSGSVRAVVAARLGPLGVASPTDPPGDGDALLSRPDDGPALVRVAAREELVIARQVVSILG